MANTNKPRGFEPKKSLVGGGQFQTNLYAIPTDASNTYAIGDVVRSLASSQIDGVRNVTKWGGATTTSALPLGIIVGFQKPSAGASLVGNSLDRETVWIPKSSELTYVIVADDPFLVFEVQFDNTAVVQADLSRNAAVTVTADQTTLSQSSPLSNTVLTSPAVTATLPVHLMGLVQEEGNEIGAYARVLAKWNYHEYGVTAGASGSVVGYLSV